MDIPWGIGFPIPHGISNGSPYLQSEKRCLFDVVGFTLQSVSLLVDLLCPVFGGVIVASVSVPLRVFYSFDCKLNSSK